MKQRTCPAATQTIIPHGIQGNARKVGRRMRPQGRAAPGPFSAPPMNSGPVLPDALRDHGRRDELHPETAHGASSQFVRRSVQETRKHGWAPFEVPPPRLCAAAHNLPTPGIPAIRRSGLPASARPPATVRPATGFLPPTPRGEAYTRRFFRLASGRYPCSILATMNSGPVLPMLCGIKVVGENFIPRPLMARRYASPADLPERQTFPASPLNPALDFANH